MACAAYTKRHPEKSDLYKIAYRYFEAYERCYEKRYESEYGYFRPIIRSTVWKYLDCGIMEHGFARARCPGCGYDFFVAFSCKTRFFCPSCAQKRTLIWGEWVSGILAEVDHRQWVFTIPKVLRKLFYKDRLLLAGLARCAAATILELYRVVFREKHFRPGIITSTQTFGDLLIWHPHIHCLVTDGAFDAVGHFHPLAVSTNDQAAQIFREKVFAMTRVGALLACAFLL